MDNFSEWLKNELESRNWKQADLVREAKLDSAVISNLINGKRKSGESTARAIAHALRLPPDLVFEKAGLLPSKPELSPAKRKLLHLADGLPDSDVEIAIALLEQREDYYKKNPQAKPIK
jgi:transcriptional regulator with XRE-family HTH domain